MIVTAWEGPVSLGAPAEGRLILIWDLTKIGVITMKMINSTRATSIKGTMLISDMRRYLSLNCSEFVMGVAPPHSTPRLRSADEQPDRFLR